MLVCEAWFEAERRVEDLILITEPHTGPLIRANIWLVIRSERDLLIDTDNGLAPLRPFA